MGKKKINSKIYHIEKYAYGRDGYITRITDPNGYLFSNFVYKTKIKPEDLPDWYVFGRYYKRFGFLSAKDVKDVYYKPNLWINHFLKDDILYVSYNHEKIEKEDVDNWTYKTYDYILDGNDILEFLNAMRTYSPNVDINPVIEQLKNKVTVLKNLHEEFRDWDFDVDEYFSKPYKRIDYKNIY